MKIYHNQLNATLNKGFFPVWLVFGDDPWQKTDSINQIKSFAQQQGFSETIRFTADDKFDWLEVVDEYQSMSLFASQKIIEIELTHPKLNDSNTKILLSLADQFHQDVILLIHGAKLDAPTQKKKWFKTYENKGCFLPIYELESKQIAPWLRQQAQLLNLQLEPALVPFLVELFEGNLPALSQELQKLSILFPNQTITLEAAEQIVIKQAKFNPFQLVDAMLSGNLTRCSSILNQLKHEDVAIGQIIWAVHKEIQQLATMLEQIAEGISQAELFKQYRIWDKKKPLYQHALSQINIENCLLALSRIAQVDLISKTSTDFDHYILVNDVLVTLYHGEVTQGFDLNYEYA